MGPAGIDLAAFHASIGSWAMVVGGGRCRRPDARTSSSLKSHSVWIVLFYLFLLLLAVSLLRHGDVHQNPGPASPRSPAASSISSVDAAIANGSSHSSGLPGQRQRQVTTLTPRKGGEALSILHFNARSLLPKRSELAQLVSGRQFAPHVIAVSETWLNDTVPDGAIVLPNYSGVFRSDRQPGSPASCAPVSHACRPAQSNSSSRGRGGLILAREGLRCRRRGDLLVWPESVWIEVFMDSPDAQT